MGDLIKVGIVIVLANWFKILVAILLIVACVYLANINSSLGELDYQLIRVGNMASYTSDNTSGIDDIKSDVSDIKDSVSNIEYRLQYPSILR